MWGMQIRDKRGYLRPDFSYGVLGVFDSHKIAEHSPGTATVAFRLGGKADRAGEIWIAGDHLNRGKRGK
jgi:hypothetical protein